MYLYDLNTLITAVHIDSWLLTVVCVWGGGGGIVFALVCIGLYTILLCSV